MYDADAPRTSSSSETGASCTIRSCKGVHGGAVRFPEQEDPELGTLLLCRWAGLIRGAVSVALVYYYFDPAGRSEDSHGATLIATTLVLVMFSILVFGAATKPLMDYLLGAQGPVFLEKDQC